MILHCCRPRNRIWKAKIVAAILSCAFIYYISTSRPLVKSDPGERSRKASSRKQLSSSFQWDNEPHISAIGLLGRPRPRNVFLTIGIPTVCRVHQRYFHTTLTSIINSTSLADRERIHIVVAVSYLNETCALEVKDTIKEIFDTHLKSGLLELIGIPVETYPPIHNLRKTFNDEEYRVQWRAKQNIDYSFLMAYNSNRSSYYIHLEDDVTAIPGYLQEIEKYIKETTEYWAMLEFSSLGFIGKLFRSSDLHKIASLLRSFYAEQPCDYLMIYFRNLMLQNGRFLKIPTLFQHHGLHSSLPNLLRNVSDQFYAMETKILRGDNPSANMYTSLITYSKNYLTNAYNKNSSGFFWSLTPKVGDTLTIVFKNPQCLQRFALTSGFPGKASDKIIGGIVELGNTTNALAKDNVKCSGLRFVGEIKNGQIDRGNITSNSGCVHLEDKTACIKLTFTEKHTEWLVIREIAVFTIP
ncbi:alpha-1,6-mannosyl-glycoprotein 4-beta-N-acetylglucosaminyltransferase-like [Pecten maximus]|uniref:alpha-1,6-mannosyl-glycoprotein 4-beta-N-acetylglucosaminyltransferase-like n=1 Tax=Pecten maximus TaxID=6579 RepID=UPI0014585230|nr:alpha-1,6-mannosyl-glycoprotein 4-beta-N-acetylglucosaminyltransferase-like [Pecten maximus]